MMEAGLEPVLGLPPFPSPQGLGLGWGPETVSKGDFNPRVNQSQHMHTQVNIQISNRFAPPLS